VKGIPPGAVEFSAGDSFGDISRRDAAKILRELGAARPVVIRMDDGAWVVLEAHLGRAKRDVDGTLHYAFVPWGTAEQVLEGMRDLGAPVKPGQRRFQTWVSRVLGDEWGNRDPGSGLYGQPLVGTGHDPRDENHLVQRLEDIYGRISTLSRRTFDRLANTWHYHSERMPGGPQEWDPS
jgi:hypothetical protein